VRILGRIRNKGVEMSQSSYARLAELERRFSALEKKIEDSPEKEAISILHAMLHESRRLQPAGSGDLGSNRGITLEDVAALYKSAPPMEGEAENLGLEIGEAAPEFTLPDADGKLISLSDYRGKVLMLAFYPLDWSPACSDQLSLYQSELEEFERRGVQPVAISVDSIYSHGAWAAVRGLTFPLLADFHPKGEVAKRYGVFRGSDGFAERALYIIDGEGVIRHKYISDRLSHIPDIYELFQQLDRIRRTRGVGTAGGR
jgi:peroxiredoxin